MKLESADLAAVLYAQGRLEAAQSECQRLLELDPHQGQVWALLGNVFHDQQKIAEATDALERASLLVVMDDASRIALASCYAAAQRTQLALELYLQLLRRDCISVAALMRLAAELDAIDRPRLAMEACRRAEKQTRDGDDTDRIAKIHFDMSYYATRAGYPLRLTEALTRRAIDLDPGNVRYRVGLVSLLIRWEQFEEAFATATTLTPRQVAGISCQCCLRRIANLLASFGDNPRASLCWKQLAKLQVASSSERVSCE